MKNSIASVELIPLSARIGNALVSYAVYVGQMVWPVDLGVLYPHPRNQLFFWKVGLSGGGLLIISAGVMASWRKRPYLLVGWLWYLVMLMPVIGIIQVGSQAHADRYTYLPQIGLCLLMAWGAGNLCGTWRYGSVVLQVAATIILTGLVLAAYLQTTYWRDSVSLWTHSLACGHESPTVHDSLGSALADQGKLNAAIEHYERALQLNPVYVETDYNLGVALARQRKLDEAIQHFERALHLEPDLAKAHDNLGIALVAQGKLNEAVHHFERALQLKPDYAKAYYDFGNASTAQGKLNEAIGHYEQALQLKSNYTDAHYNLGNVLTKQERLSEAVRHYEKALQLKPDFAEAYNNLGRAFSKMGRWAEAREHFEKALQINPHNAATRINLGYASAALGKVEEAIQYLQQALEIATRQGNRELAESARARLQAIQTGLPQVHKP